MENASKIHEFQVVTTRVRVKVDKKTRNRERIVEHPVYKFKGCFRQNKNGDFVMDLQYGYESHTTICKEDAFSARPFQTYRSFHQVQPKEGDVITHVSSGRQFTVGKDMDGFLLHMFPLIENGVVKAYVKSEDYYKD